MELYSGPSYSVPSPTRRDTISTVSSDKYAPIPPGFWALTLHGNCARCNHHHRSAVVHIKISDEPSEVSHLMCEHCHQKWLTIGGRNSTQLSLLSARTTELDAEEVTFRRALINIVRSTTSLVSPTVLASVPEASTRHPSPKGSQRSVSGRVYNNTPCAPQNEDVGLDRNRKTRSMNTPPDHQVKRFKDVEGQAPRNRSKTMPGKFLRSLKSKLKGTLPTLLRVRTRNFVSSVKAKPLTNDELPGKTIVQSQHHSTTHEGSRSSSNHEVCMARRARIIPNFQLIRYKLWILLIRMLQETAQASKHSGQRYSIGSNHHLDRLKRVDREALKHMTSYERRIWIRSQITNFKTD